jgi:hypothetical protein
MSASLKRKRSSSPTPRSEPEPEPYNAANAPVATPPRQNLHERNTRLANLSRKADIREMNKPRQKKRKQKKKASKTSIRPPQPNTPDPAIALSLSPTELSEPFENIEARAKHATELWEEGGQGLSKENRILCAMAERNVQALAKFVELSKSVKEEVREEAKRLREAKKKVEAEKEDRDFTDEE